MSSRTNALREHYRWVIVAAGGLLGCVAIGALFCLPVLLRGRALWAQAPCPFARSQSHPRPQRRGAR